MSSRTAVIMVDMQNMYLQPEKRAAFGWPKIYRFEEVVAECAALLAEARRQGIPVIYTRQVSRVGGADLTPSSKALMKSLESKVEPDADGGFWATQILDQVKPEDGDIIMEKPRWDAFYGTELDSILRNLDVTRLVIAGLQTNVCVETTTRTALMKNFEVGVPEDAVSTDGKSLHVNGLNSMRVLYAEVAPWRELLAPGQRWERALTTPRYGRSDADYAD